MKRFLKSSLTTLGILAVIGVLYAFTTTGVAEYNTQEQPEWENLEVLPQNISKDSLKDVMRGFSSALGVKCSYCHAPKKNNPKKLDFPSDDKIEKEIARGMMKMTGEINAHYFKPHFPDPKPDKVHVVSCVTCHRGTANPEKYLSKMSSMYKTYNPDRDNRKEKILEQRRSKK